MVNSSALTSTAAGNRFSPHLKAPSYARRSRSNPFVRVRAPVRRQSIDGLRVLERRTL